MIKANITTLRNRLTDMTSAIAQTDNILLGYQRAEAFFNAHNGGTTTAQDTAVLADITDSAAGIVAAYNAAVSVFTAEDPI
jgi:hypothetical protein